jgi:hypothetical protein
MLFFFFQWSGCTGSKFAALVIGLASVSNIPFCMNCFSLQTRGTGYLAHLAKEDFSCVKQNTPKYMALKKDKLTNYSVSKKVMDGHPLMNIMYIIYCCASRQVTISG